MAKVAIEGDELVVTFGTVYRLLTWCGALRIPFAQIEGTGPGEVEMHARRVLQWPGVWAPGTILAGIFLNEDGRTIWDVRDIRTAVAIYLTGNPYRAVIAGVDDPDATIAAITRAVALFRSR